MAYVGNPIDTQNTFQSLVGKRFDGDGSTTDFTLDVAPGSVLDIEVFVGNVRQDPNSAYTLSGTTLTFTGAPPSGTNNIYVVHQAKSVGTIDVPSSFLSTEQTFTGGLDINGTELKLDADADTSITADTDDQIDVKIAGADDFQFTANTFTAQSGSTITTPTLGVGTARDQGVLHVRTADTSATAGTDSDELILENSAAGGMTILSATDANGKIAFGDSGDADAGAVIYEHDGNNLRFHTNGSEKMRIHSGGAISIGSTSVVDPSSDTGGAIALQPGGLSTFLRSGNAALSLQRTTNNGRVLQFYRDTTERGYVEVDGSSTTYATSSDYRLKENIVDLDNAVTRLKELKPRRFNFIGQEDTRDGFVAHEVTTVPEAISGTKDEVDEKGEPIYQGIDPSKIVPLLTAALQEAVTKIETLEAKVKTLEEA